MTSAAFNQPLPSPCVGVCTLDESDCCVGCHRTVDEITRWSSLSDDERERIMMELPGRARARQPG